MPLDRVGIGKRLKAEREAQNLSQAALAKRLDCSQRTVAEIERGGSFSARLVRDAAAILGVTEGWLETGHGAKFSPRAVSETAAHELRPGGGRDYRRIAEVLIGAMPDEMLLEKIPELTRCAEFDAAQVLIEELKRRTEDKR